MPESKLVVKTFEFPYPEPIPTEWLETATTIWNQGLALLEWLQHYRRLLRVAQGTFRNHYERLDRYDNVLAFVLDYSLINQEHDLRPAAIDMHKVGEEWAPSCKIGRDVRIDRTKSWDKENLEFRPCCQLVPLHWMTKPPIESFTHYDLKKRFSKKAGFDYKSMPSSVMQSCVMNLCKSWKAYQQGAKGKPRYRGARNKVGSIHNEDFRNGSTLDGEMICLPKMEAATIPGLRHLQPKMEQTRQFLLENPTPKLLQRAEKTSLEEAAKFYALPGTYSLIQYKGKTFLQLTTYCVVTESPSDRERSITTNELHLWQDAENDGNTVEHVDNRHLDRRIQALKKKLSKKTYKSNAWNKLHQRIRQLQQRKARRTKSRQKYHGQMLGRSNIVIEPYTAQIEPKPVPRPDGEGGYAPNGATAIAAHNERRAKAATSQFVSILKQQASENGNLVTDNRKSDADPPKKKSTKKKRGRNRKRERAIG